MNGLTATIDHISQKAFHIKANHICTYQHRTL